MTFDPTEEPCSVCGREPDECVCELAPDFPNDFIPELDSDYLDWDFYDEGSNDEGAGQENTLDPREDGDSIGGGDRPAGTDRD